MQIFAIVVSFALTIGALALLIPAVRTMVGVIRNGQPAPGRTDNPVGRGRYTTHPGCRGTRPRALVPTSTVNC